jgi:hypothetical protein
MSGREEGLGDLGMNGSIKATGSGVDNDRTMRRPRLTKAIQRRWPPCARN